MVFNCENYDVIVLGAGHAGCEAALAAARMGQSVLCLTMNLDAVALMACNPAIGGTSKGHLVREVDALGGEMGLATDDCFIQIRMLNTGKGPAVHSLRAQMDKRRYHERMKRALERQENLHLMQDECARILTENGHVTGIETALGARYGCRAIVVATGVYLKGRVLIGEYDRESGPSGLAGANLLSASLQELGFSLRRFKTGTPARLNRRSLDFSEMEPQYGEEGVQPFSFLHSPITREQVPCYLTYTNPETHEIIRSNLDRSPLYAGKIHGKGPRYCPSIEDKVVRFAEKERHQIFIEPEGLSTDEMYVQGMSSCLPFDVQVAAMRTMPGLHHCEVMRPAYAIEYDCIDSTVLSLSLGAKDIAGLYFAGQINGSSGYEEAAAQGILAGINAALYLKNEPPFTLGRDEAYAGVLCDDLATRGTDEPYRMMTSRAEYRLLLRQDNADLRLTEKARRTGLISDERYNRLCKKQEELSRAMKALGGFAPHTEALSAYLAEKGETLPQNGVTFYDLLKRHGIGYTDLARLFPEELPEIGPEASEQAEIHARYDGYIEKQSAEVRRMRALEETPLPKDFDYRALAGLRLEAREKLSRRLPENLGQASRIPGVSPADISVLMVALKGMHRERKGSEA